MIDPRKFERGIRLLVFASVAVVAALFIRNYSFYEIPDTDGSLLPSYPGGSRVLVKTVGEDDPLERGWDVVYAMEREGQLYARFGRVRALPGDVVAVIEGELTVNGTPLKPVIRVDRAMGVVPDGSILILPFRDQISNYPDSRTLGFIPRSDVQERVLARMP